MRIIGLTGGIACGKSTASAHLRELGARIVDTDAISRECTLKGHKGYEAVVGHFGAGILREDGQIDRRKLGSIVFGDEGRRRELNGLLHPVIINEAMEQAEQAKRDGSCVCVLDVPLLFETGMERLCDETWLVYVPREEQVRRIVARDGLSEEAACARIDSQMPLEEKLRRADVAIDNSGSVAELKETLDALWEERA